MRFPSIGWLDLLAVVGLGLALAAGRGWLGARAALDNDRHYHLGLSRLSAAHHGRLEALPQVEDLGWGKRFDDKEYLFHVFTRWGFSAAGEDGVLAVGAVIAFLAVAAVYALCRTGAGVAVSFALTAIGAIANEWFLYRLLLLRPHVLAIALALGFTVGLVRRSPWVTAIAGFAFALAYHAFYVPLGLAVLFGVLGRRDRAARASAGLGMVGLVIGAVVNPYFPQNVAMGALGAHIAWGAGHAHGIGVELLPVSIQQYLLQFGAPLFLAGLSTVTALWGLRSSGSTARYSGLMASAWVFWVLAWVTPRAAEYAIPLSVAAAAHAVSAFSRLKQGVVVAASALVQIPAFVGSRTPSASDRYAQSVAVAIERLPAEAAGKKIFNCSFDEGAVLLDLRPDVRFIDVLDPELLKRAAPRLAMLREQFQQGAVADPLQVVRGAFGADYVLCGYPAAVAMLDADPQFIRLSPALGENVRGPAHYLFQVVNEPLPSTDLGQVPSEREPNGCARFNIDAEQLAQHSGAELALIGGAPTLALEVDGTREFETVPPAVPRRWNSVLVLLKTKITAAQRVSLEACPGDRASASGASLSLWTWEQVERRCAQIGRPLPAPDDATRSARPTCLAPHTVVAPTAVLP